jgi:succinoglycan biosynthesis transport protein ExoP
MSGHSLFDLIVRRRWMVIACVVGAALAAAGVSATLDRSYTTSAKLLIVPSGDAASFDATQAAQVTARTYSDVLSSPNFAQLVAKRLGEGTSVERSVEIEPIPETQLLDIRASGSSPARARRLADAYADVFLEYQARALAPTTKASVSLADAAPTPVSPSRPRPLINILLGCLLALPLGVMLAFLRERFDTRLSSVEEIGERFGLPVLARVPLRTRSDASSGAFDEAFRMLRTMVRFTAGGKTPRTIAVTSASEGEGKTTTTLALAMSALEAGQKVLVVEADPYRPRLMAMLDDKGDTDLDHREPGLSDYLMGASTMANIIHPTAVPGLLAVPAGPMPPSMSGLLEGSRGRGLMRKLAEHADFVLVDCPPIGLSADAALLAANADAVLFVFDLKVSSGAALSESLGRLQSASATPLGVVVNRDTTQRVADYGYYAHDRPITADPLAAFPDDEEEPPPENGDAPPPPPPAAARRRTSRRTPAS